MTYDPLNTQRVLAELAAERMHQVRVKQHTPDEDDGRLENELCRAAAILCLETSEVYAAPRGVIRTPHTTGWTNTWPTLAPVMPAGRIEQRGEWPAWLSLELLCPVKHGTDYQNRRRQLVIAGALVTAEIERLDRAEEAAIEAAAALEVDLAEAQAAAELDNRENLGNPILTTETGP